MTKLIMFGMATIPSIGYMAYSWQYYGHAEETAFAATALGFSSGDQELAAAADELIGLGVFSVSLCILRPSIEGTLLLLEAFTD